MGVELFYEDRHTDRRTYIDEARLQASATNKMRSALFWDVMQHMMVIPYRRFGTTYQSHLQGSRPFLLLLQLFVFVNLWIEKFG